jgi:hypothetical protein
VHIIQFGDQLSCAINIEQNANTLSKNDQNIIRSDKKSFDYACKLAKDFVKLLEL